MLTLAGRGLIPASFRLAEWVAAHAPTEPQR